MASKSKKKAITQKTPAEVPEVLEFLSAAGQLEAFRIEHESVIKQFDTLAEEYNQKLEAAEKVCRAQAISCGPFDLYQFKTTYDPKVLYDLVGHERFIKIGGSMHTETVYEVDKAKIDMAIDQGLIPQDVVEVVRKESPTFHAPKKISTS